MQRLRPPILRAAVLAFGCFGLSPSSSSAFSWESIGPGAGSVDGLTQSRNHPDRMYCLLSKQGLHRSDDRGESWARVDSGLDPLLSLRIVQVSPTNPDLLLVVQSGTTILRSTDAGESWTTPTLGPGVVAFAFDPFDGDLVLASVTTGPPTGIHRSTDAGATWMLSNDGIGAALPNGIAFDPFDSSHVLVASNVGVFNSTDGGMTWTLSNGAPPVGSVSFSEANPQVVWASSSTGVVRSTDGGQTFVDLGQLPVCSPFNCNVAGILGSPTSENEVHCATRAVTGEGLTSIAVRRSTDAGTTWSPYAPFFVEQFDNQMISAFRRDPQLGQVFYFGIRSLTHQIPVLRGLQASTDNGATWQPRMRGLHALSVFEIAADISGTVFLRAPTTDGLWRRDPGDEDWTEIEAGLSPTDPSLSTLTLFAAHEQQDGLLFEGGTHLNFDVGVPLFYRSTDAGASWEQGDVPHVLLFQPPRVVAASPNAQAVYLWCSYFSVEGVLCRSTDGGLNFDVVSDDPSPADAVALSPLSVLTISGAVPGEVRLSTDGGVSWMPRSQGLPADVGVELFLGPLIGPPELIAVYRQSGAFRSTNLGVSWSPMELPGYSGEAVVDADWSPAFQTLCFATEDHGVYRSDLGFVTDGLPASELTSIEFVGATDACIAGTQNASAFLLQPGDEVAIPVLSETPSSVRIFARPNPSRGATDFEFSLPTVAKRVRIAIIDVAGRLVANVFEGARTAGIQTAKWNGRTTSGVQVAPGSYFARLEVDDVVVSTRITVLAD